MPQIRLGIANPCRPSNSRAAGRASVVCRIAFAAALIGIAIGVVLSVTQSGAGRITFDGISVPPFATWMLGPIVLGCGAAVLAVVDIVRRDAGYKRPLFAFVLGLASIATPFLFAIVATVCVIAMIVLLVVSLGS